MRTTSLTRADVESLRARLTGHVVTPDDDSYDQVRRLWNGAFDRRPALIARCAATEDVQHAVRFAREHDLIIAVRGGGHSIPGLSSCDGGLLIDLQPMTRIHVDPVARVATAQPGLTWGPFDAATQKHGLATTGGEVSHTGIAGLTLGGGIGWLKRKHGLTCDNLLGVEVVTADGDVVRADDTMNPELFWALRGGGGNFGIVTEFRYRLHPVGIHLGGSLMFAYERGREALEAVRELAASIGDDTSLLAGVLTAPPAPFVPADLQGRRVVVAGAYHLGPVDEGERIVQPLRRIGPAVDMLQPIPYVALQRMVDDSVPHGRHYYVKSDMLTGLDDTLIDAVLESGAAMTSPFCQILLPQMGGAVGRVAREATAFTHRDAAFMSMINASWTADDAADRHVRWARDTWAAMRPSATGTYVNHLGAEGEDRVREAYGDATYRRLRTVKTRWDPENVFRLNQNIQPERRARRVVA